jgi:2,4-dienoyl-CoA reductase-like NADH-dependent reductase (Old Yellow Enzyme family)
MNLFSPLQLRSVTLKNRIAVSPMCQYSATDGFANDWHLVHLGTRAIGGAGLVMTEAAAVSPEGRISSFDLGIWKDEHILELRRITNFIHQNGSVAGIQLAHAGYKASSQQPWNGNGYISPENGGWQSISPSEVLLADKEHFSREISVEEIHRITNNFKAAAQRAIEAGFKIIELHAAHGYLVHEFFSPLINKRTDNYGGSFENRIRILLEIIEAVRGVIPSNFPLFVRISATDWVENGWTIEDSIRLAEILKNKEIDLIDCSSGGLVSPKNIPVGLSYQVPFAESIRAKTGIKTGAVGMILSPQQAEEIITSGKADLVLLAREILRNPYFPQIAAHELGYDIELPLQYLRGKR